MLTCLLFHILIIANDIPEINKKITLYIDQVIGKQVDRGECWDLAAAALDFGGGYLDRSNQKSIYIFGETIDPRSDKVYPGDIIQFEGVVLEYQEKNMIITEKMPHHTAIIYKVQDDGHYVIAHQNTRTYGRKVGLTELKLDDLKKGKLIFYRPVAGK
jgi:hypothetical protein